MKWLGLAILPGVYACQPALDSQPTLISEARILAVQSEPAEAAPGSAVTLRALAVSSAGTLSAEIVSWALCNHERSIAENNSVAPECLRAEASWIVPIAEEPASQPISALLPDDGCSTFGSQPLPPDPGEPPNRPTDPDATGGYYQPVRANLEQASSLAFGHVRLRCDLPAAPVDIARAYGERYTNNLNPALLELSRVDGGTDSVGRGTSIELQALWSPESAEPFVVYDSLENDLLEHVETLRVSWFATAGAFSVPRTESELGASSATVSWHSPDQSRSIELWAVLRDDRGGVSWQSLSVDVR